MVQDPNGLFRTENRVCCLNCFRKDTFIYLTLSVPRRELDFDRGMTKIAKVSVYHSIPCVFILIIRKIALL